MSISHHIKEIGCARKAHVLCRMPQMDGFVAGRRQWLQEAQTSALAGKNPLPAPIAAQVEHILHLVFRI